MVKDDSAIMVERTVFISFVFIEAADFQTVKVFSEEDNSQNIIGMLVGSDGIVD